MATGDKLFLVAGLIDTNIIKCYIDEIFGDVAQRESIAFATRGSWVQIPSSPPNNHR